MKQFFGFFAAWWSMEEHDEDFLDLFRRVFSEARFAAPCEAVVVGAGVSGLTVALGLLVNGNSVRVVADEFDVPTSAVAAAVWLPYLSDDGRTMTWSQQTLEWYDAFLQRMEAAHGNQNLSVSPKSSRNNPVCWVDGLSLSEHAGADFLPDYPQWLPQRRFVDDAGQLPDPCWKRGLAFRTVVMQTHLYMPLLRRLCTRLGAVFERRRLQHSDLEELRHRGLVFNCASLGCVDLVRDDQLYPIQGQVVKYASVVLGFVPTAQAFAAASRVTGRLYTAVFLIPGAGGKRAWTTARVP